MSYHTCRHGAMGKASTMPPIPHNHVTHPSPTNSGLRLVYRVRLGLRLEFFVYLLLDYIRLKISTYLNLIFKPHWGVL